MKKIPFGVPGKVLNASHPNMMVRVEYAREGASDVLIYTWWDGSDGPNRNGAFDNWLPSEGELDDYFAHQGWIVEWEKT